MQNCENQTIAIIDSGIGGVSVLKQLIVKYKAGNYIYFADNQFMPYGNKSQKWLRKRVDYIIDMLKNKYNVDHIMVACNTASSIIDKYKYINVYPMTFQEKQIYFATDLTKRNLPLINVISDKKLAKNIENNIFNETKINKIVKYTVKKHNLDKLNEFILACTHYELVKSVFEKSCTTTKITNNSSFLLKELNLENSSKELNIVIMLSKKSVSMENKIIRLLKE